MATGVCPLPPVSIRLAKPGANGNFVRHENDGSIAHRDRPTHRPFLQGTGVRSLALFGSVLREDFDPKQSDIDVRAEFAPGALHGVGLRYFDFAEDLGAILGHRVDFSSPVPPSAPGTG
ncbi:MAG: nucleotidyltransferase domain-containing protein [Chthoniobacterales bacterium]